MPNTSLRQEALLNEYKGNLYEYLVGLNIAQSEQLELEFLDSLTPDFKIMLSQQEQFIREYYPQLLIDLPLLASNLSQEIISSLAITNITKVMLMGKAALAANDNRFSEADILITNDGKLIPISLKICKANSFVNTKSAGLKSFFKKYFDNESVQVVFNKKVDSIVDKLTFDLYALADLEFDANYANWLENGHPSLPGQLEGEYRNRYLKQLYSLTEELYCGLKEVCSSDRESFIHNLLPIIGFSSPDIIQASTFYQLKDGKYQQYAQRVESCQHILEKLNEVSFPELKKNITNFDIFFSDRTLQIRVKAMNKFTSKSYKINCSVKKN